MLAPFSGKENLPVGGAATTRLCLRSEHNGGLEPSADLAARASGGAGRDLGSIRVGADYSIEPERSKLLGTARRQETRMTRVTSAVTIPLPDGKHLDANLDGPGDAPLVVFAHGSGSSRHSPRNQHVATVLNDSGLRTLLLDLLTVEEERRDLITAEHRFDIGLLGERVGNALAWANGELSPPSLGIFGASTGAAAALVAAAANPASVAAVVSRGGRPDLASEVLSDVVAPTLLIVGGRDLTVLDLNREALRKLGEGHELDIVEGATHLFEEPGALDEVAVLAANWFNRHLAD